VELILNSKKKHSFDGFHPWVLEHSLIEPTLGPVAGQTVDLVTANGHWIGRGIYNPNSRIRVRLYQWQQGQELDEVWLAQQLLTAVEMRRQWMNRHGTIDAVRWVNSEGDGLSGLIIDQFADYIIVQINALAMLAWEAAIIEWLRKHLGALAICVRIDGSTANSEGILAREEWVVGQAPEQLVQLSEGPVKLLVDLSQGQKTGYYLDQRSNRQRAAQWIGPGPMLDVCCYLGGFSLTAGLIAKPVSITAVDSSLKMLEQADRNAKLNQLEIDFVQADCFDYLAELAGAGAQFETIILDPPKMASSRQQIQAALRAYHRLNLSAVNLLQPGGMLITCSCSGRVSRDDFRGVLAAVAQRSRRSIQILETLGADFDHPIQVHCPETEYLKCFICRVN
jgi:23S rRNA (cytosine1962-C5)-methyltransferase